MRTLISSIILAFAVSAPAFAADSVKVDQAPAKISRAISEPVKVEGGTAAKPGRKIDDTEIKTPASPFLDNSDKNAVHKGQSHAIDRSKGKKLKDVEGEGGVTDPCAVGACLDKDQKKASAGAKKGKVVSNEVKSGNKDASKVTRAASEEVKSGKDGTEKQGRAVEKSDKK